MKTDYRLLVAFAAVAVLPMLAGCGEDPVLNAESDPGEVLAQAFGGEEQSVDSGAFELTVSVDSSGGEQPGTVEVGLAGPFDSNGESALPDFDFDLTADVTIAGDERSYVYGAAATGERAWINFEGIEYELDAATYDQLAAGFAASASAAQADGSGVTLTDLGLDPASWLTAVSNEGLADVEGAETVHVSGSADIEALFADISELAATQPIPAGELPSAEEIGELAEVVETADVDVYSGADDGILRRFTVALELANPDDPGSSIAADFDLTLSEVNEEQEITAPENARPIADLLAGLGGLGGLAPGLPVPD